MSLKCGIVGLPNVGKSTLFNALTKAGIAAENYPFCTIEPNVGVVEVPDPRLTQLADIVKPEKVVPAVVEFVDIAGLVAGASKGEGLGNQFLANIRETDAITHVVRCFDDPNVIHVSNKVDPLADIETINTELALADLANVEKQVHRVSKLARSGGDKEAARLLPLLESWGGTASKLSSPAPPLSALTAVSSLPLPVSMMTRVCGARAMMRLSTSRPSMPGRPWSSSTTCGFNCSNSTRPASPLNAISTAIPSRSRKKQMFLASVGSSSIKRTVGIMIGFPLR